MARHLWTLWIQPPSSQLNAEPYSMPTFTSSLLSWTALTTVCTRTSLLLLAIHQHGACALPIWSFLSNAFSSSTNPKWVSCFSLQISPASCDKYCINRSFTFHEIKLHVIYFCLLYNSMFTNPFNHFDVMLQQLYSSVWTTLHGVTLALVNWQYHTGFPVLWIEYIPPIPLHRSVSHWIEITPVACIISATNPGALCFFIFFSTTITSGIVTNAICRSLFYTRRDHMIPFIFFIHQIFHIILPRVFNYGRPAQGGHN